MLTDKHMFMMYNHLCEKKQYNMFVLTLQPIAYVVEEKNEESVFKQKEILLLHRGAVKEFEVAYLCYGLRNRNKLDMLRWT